MATIERRTTDKKEISFRVKIRLIGHPIQTASFRRLTDAKNWAQSTEAAIREGRCFKSEESKKHTFGEAVDRYISDVLPTKPKNLRSQRSQLEWWKIKLGRYTLADITPAASCQLTGEWAKAGRYDCSRPAHTL
jgi:hypothetical protein